jgi:hypothetical protein
MLRELSSNLEKDRERERSTQLKAMEVEVSKFKVASEQGDMASLMRVKMALTAQLKKYLDNIEADKEDGVSSDVTGKWKKAALDLTKVAIEQLNGIGRDVGAEGEDALGPLRRVLGKVASLSKAVTHRVSEPEEGGLRDLGKRLGVIKKELMALNRELMVSHSPALAMEAHELASEAEDAIKASQKTIKAALRGLGAASDKSKAGSLDTPPPPETHHGKPRSPTFTYTGGGHRGRLPPRWEVMWLA